MPSRLRTETIIVNTVGGAGVAVGEASSRALSGTLLDVYLDYHASAPATTDVTISHEDPSRGNIIVRTDSATDGLFSPRVATHKSDSTATGAYDTFPINGKIKVAVAQCNALTGAVTVRLTYIDQ
jgi:hypothetical protein